MNVICIEDEAFYKLIDEVVDRIKEKEGINEDKWITGDDSMRLLNVKSKSTMQKLRDEGRIRFSQHHRNIILYDRESLLQYLEDHAKETF